MKHMEYIRKTYNVPAKRGARIEYSGDEVTKFLMGFLYTPRKGTIVAARDGYIRVRMDNSDFIQSFHPTWKINYL